MDFLDTQGFQTTLTELGILDKNEKFINMNDSEMFDEINNSLAKVGSKLSLESVTRIVRFQQKWRQAKIDAQWSVYGNLIIVGSLIAILTMLCFFYRCVPWKRCFSRTSQDEAEDTQQGVLLSNLRASQASAPPPTPDEQPREEPKIDAKTRTLIQDTATLAATAALEMRKSKKTNQTPTFDDLAYNY